MDTGVLIFAIVLFRLFLFLVKSHLQRGSFLLIVVLLTIIASALPLALFKMGVLEESGVNILIAGFVFFYFPFVMGRMNK
ncbi:hypothetical protein ACJJIE_09745 [Microbulbifer sp. TRSA001]|uniref:hypothetical protein n=1 Tax=Microbulbifer sp. TRSA001 TaxID=3243381 RepID=UPI004039379A